MSDPSPRQHRVGVQIIVRDPPETGEPKVEWANTLSRDGLYLLKQYASSIWMEELRRVGEELSDRFKKISQNFLEALKDAALDQATKFAKERLGWKDKERWRHDKDRARHGGRIR